MHGTADRLIDVAGQASLALLGKGTSSNVIGLGREFVKTGFGRVALMEGHLQRQDASAVLPYRWVKHDFLEVRSLSKSTEFLKGIDDAMKPYGKGIQGLTIATKAWGVFGKEHDRKDLSEAEALVSTAWKVGTEQGGSWVGGKIGAEAGAWGGAQAGAWLGGAVFGPPGVAAGAVAGAIVGGFVGAWKGGDWGGKAGKLVQVGGEKALKIGTGLGRSVGKGAGHVVKKLNPFRW